jgi:hypothetical protein
MPELYVSIRDGCVKRKEKKTGKPVKVDSKAYNDCQRMAAVQYFKKTGKPVQHEDTKAMANLSDPLELEILSEQLDLFGTFEEYDNWNSGG